MRASQASWVGLRVLRCRISRGWFVASRFQQTERLSDRAASRQGRWHIKAVAKKKSTKAKRPGASRGRASIAKQKARARWRWLAVLSPVTWLAWLWRRVLRRVFAIGLRIGAIAAVIAVVWVAAYRVIDPPGGFYMLSEAWRLGGVERRWTDLDQMDPDLALAAMAAEDARFCDHAGFDIEAISQAFAENAEGRRLRGGSTISQQVAKNVFLWHQRSWLRKGLEAGFTIVIEVIWPKSRIIEVYLNTVEFDEGVFGAEAAARHYFGQSAGSLSRIQAARLAAVLPDPKGRSAASPGRWTARRANAIASGIGTLAAGSRGGCVRKTGKG